MTEDLKHEQIYSMLNLLEASRLKNHTIQGIFLFGSGVINARARTTLGKNNRNIPQELAGLITEQIPVYACQTWADAYGIDGEGGIAGLQVTGLGELSTLVKEADKVIVFGAHA